MVRRVPFPLAAGLIGATLLLLGGLLLADRVPAVDQWGLDTMRVASDGPMEPIIHALSDGLWIAAMAGCIASLGWLLWRGRRRALGPALGSVAVFLVLAPSSELLKDLFGRPHPVEPLEYSFPSTHVTMVTVSVVIAAAIGARLAPQWRRFTVAVAFAAILVTAATRVLLGEHHLTDVAVTAAGYAGLGLLGVTLARLPTPTHLVGQGAILRPDKSDIPGHPSAPQPTK